MTASAIPPQTTRLISARTLFVLGQAAGAPAWVDLAIALTIRSSRKGEPR